MQKHCSIKGLNILASVRIIYLLALLYSKCQPFKKSRKGDCEVSIMLAVDYILGHTCDL